MQREEILKNCIGSEDNYCEGFFVSPSRQNYILGANYAVAKVEKDLSHAGSNGLDEINAFDKAEVAEANIGQINMMTVSSFCGPKGLIWGLDICKTPKVKNEWGLKVTGFDNIPVYSVDELVRAFKMLTGTVDKPNFPFFPGSHVPCAKKFIKVEGEKVIYSALAIGIPKDRSRNACLLMEDNGLIPLSEKDNPDYKKMIATKAVKSVLKIGGNLKVDYMEIYVGVKDLYVGENEIGCALVASPYFVLPKKAVVKGESLFDLDIEKWKLKTKKI